MVFRNQWLIAPKRQRHLEQLVQHSGVIRYYIRRKPFMEYWKQSMEILLLIR